MAINLQKGQKVDISLSNLSVGLGWNPNEGTGNDFDLDASAFMLNANRMIPSEGHFIFYNQPDSPDTALHHTGDDPTGGNSAEGDDETIMVNLQKVSADIQEILFVVTIHNADERRQNFGQVRNSYIRIVDNNNGSEICKYELGEDFSIETAVEFGRLYRREGNWKFEASGIGYQKDLSFFVEKYYTGQVIK
ncbi:MAG: TerD family protein [Bacteroidia bacterium]|jgi:tellurium resistance protein TerD|nr:TerD family protein [Bacteroidia bacterium]